MLIVNKVFLKDTGLMKPLWPFIQLHLVFRDRFGTVGLSAQKRFALWYSKEWSEFLLEQRTRDERISEGNYSAAI